MNLKSKKFIQYLILGYLLIIMLVLASASLFFFYESRIATTFNHFSQYAQQEKWLKEVQESAIQRSILMTKMIHSVDLFEVDKLQQTVYSHENAITDRLVKLNASGLTEQQSRLLDITRNTMLQNLSMQTKIYQLLMDDQKQIAIQQLINVTLPLQAKVQSSLTDLENEFNEQKNSANIQFKELIFEMKSLIFLVSLPIMLSLFSVATLSVRKLKRYAQEQNTLLETLESRVQKRTQELLMDRKLLRNLNEAIAIMNHQGHLILTNARFKTLFSLCGDSCQDTCHSEPVWDCLKNCFENLNAKEIQTQIRTQKYRQEVNFYNEDTPKTFILDIEEIFDASFPEAYFSLILTDISELKATEKHLAKLASFDAVTGLHNRHSFNTQLDKLTTQSPSKPFALIFLDFNHFKWVNDHFGHAEGDQFLHHIGQLCKDCVTEQDMVARLGGDEFALIVYGEYEPYQLNKLANRLLNNLDKINTRHSSEHKLGCSMGLARFPEDAQDSQTLLKHADYAMYQSKDLGQHQFRIFSDDMLNHLNYLEEIEKNLHRAVKNHDFSLHYQPQYSLKTNQVIGAEALIRWQTQDRFIPPNEFIPLAEKFKLIEEIGEFVFQEAVSQFRIWCPKGLTKMAINASSIQLSSGNFGNFVEQVLKHEHVAASQIDIEVTETVMMENIEEAQGTNSCLSNLQGQGLEISIDDFGTGYSSLSYIKHLNVDRIKIDKSFIDDIDINNEAKSIVNAIINMGHSLGLKVLAEGIETEQQLAILRELGCDEGQGYYFNKPLPPKEFDRLCLQQEG